MKIARVGTAGSERPVVLDASGNAFDLSGVVSDVDGAFLAGGGLSRVRAELDRGRLPPLSMENLRTGPPVARPGKVVCLGYNYLDHAEETGARTPREPKIFMKASNTVVGAYDDVMVPRGSTKTDWEIELGVVIGRTARYLDSPDDAAKVIAGYAVSNDVSEREFQIERGGQWTKGKSCETFNPLGPWLVPAAEIADVQDLGLRLWVNGEQRQNGSTKNMIFDVAYVIWYLSQFMVLDPGDLINTGTPAGVALGMPDPKPYLRAGDVVEAEIDGLGKQRQVMVQA